MQLIETLIKIISNEVGSFIQARPDSDVRVVLRGLPESLLNSLFQEYSEKGGVQVPGHENIRVLQVSDDQSEDDGAICRKQGQKKQSKELLNTPPFFEESSPDHTPSAQLLQFAFAPRNISQIRSYLMGFP